MSDIREYLSGTLKIEFLLAREVLDEGKTGFKRKLPALNKAAKAASFRDAALF